MGYIRGLGFGVYTGFIGIVPNDETISWQRKWKGKGGCDFLCFLGCVREC